MFKLKSMDAKLHFIIVNILTFSILSDYSDILFVIKFNTYIAKHTTNK